MWCIIVILVLFTTDELPCAMNCKKCASPVFKGFGIRNR